MLACAMPGGIRSRRTAHSPDPGFFGEPAARALGLGGSSARAFAMSGTQRFAITHLSCLSPCPDQAQPIRPERAWAVSVQRRPLDRYRLCTGGREQPGGTLRAGSVLLLDLRCGIEFAPAGPVDCVQV